MIGTVFLKKYEAVGFLGQGSMGRVYLARDLKRPGKNVVVKVMQSEVAQKPRFRQLFQRELQNMARLNHPYVVHLRDGSADDPAGPCIIMDYISGTPLEDILIREKFVDLDRAGMMLGRLCHALDAAHKIGLIHRDLKPANLMITDPGAAEESLAVMDLGLASLSAKPYIPLERLTGRGGGYIAGTPTHVSPEQVMGSDLDGRADLYAVGVILYELLAGTLPFTELRLQDLFEAHLKQTPPRFEDCRRGPPIPEAVEDVVRGCMAKYPNERPESARGLAERFGDALGWSIWDATSPDQSMEHSDCALPDLSDTGVGRPWTGPADPNVVCHTLEAWMPEQIAVYKLRGFVEDSGGSVTGSEPGWVWVQFGEPEPEPEPPPKAGLTGWLRRFTGGPAMAAPPAAEPLDPVAVELEMDKPQPGSSLLRITARYRPVEGCSPRNALQWRARCEKIHNDLRAYLIAGG